MERDCPTRSAWVRRRRAMKLPVVACSGRTDPPAWADAWGSDFGLERPRRCAQQIVGRETLSNADVEGARKRPDGIPRSAWPIELHKGDVPRMSWPLDDYDEIPFNCFVPPTGN